MNKKFEISDPYTRMKLFLKKNNRNDAVFKFVDNSDGNGIVLAYYDCGECDDQKCEKCLAVPTENDLKSITENEIKNFDEDRDNFLQRLKKYLKPECFLG